MAEPIIDFRNFLRNNLTDYNTSRKAVGTGQGVQWIFDDPPLPSLDKWSYPRIGLDASSGMGELLGAGSTDIYETIVIGVEIWSFKGLELVVGGSLIKDYALVDKIANDVRSNLRQQWATSSDLSEVKYNGFRINRDKRVPYVVDRRRYGRVMDIELLAFNPGE